ncbi:acetoin reductase [Streptomyces samsunensis]|uniref:acetoin reductase n=1 Tax=Streptomyces malaysiensis TaxID=92644 RepID=UPI001583192E|nr:acetoin reductase [Streptomyces samsunensis]NUH42553.1 acetoin reductase [Streptomyces samsunensis]
MRTPLEGKAAVITGAGQGIGRAIALRLAADGADIAILDLNIENAKRVAAEVEALGRRAYAAVSDVSDRDSLHAAVEGAEKELGGFDIMINNAGIAQVLPLLEVRPSDFERITQINIGGVLWGTQAAAASFINRGVKGKIINASSIAGHTGQPVFGVYSATKFAVRGLTQAAAQEYARYGITVNAYCPGTVGTGMWEEIDHILAERDGVPIGASFRKQAGGIALGRPETPEDVAGFVAYLAGPDSDYMTGQAPLIDGGMLFI